MGAGRFFMPNFVRARSACIKWDTHFWRQTLLEIYHHTPSIIKRVVFDFDKAAWL